MPGELVVDDNQYQIRDLLIGASSKFVWEGVAPTWWGSANVRTNDTPYMAAHGVRGGRDLLGSKTVLGKIAVLADDDADLQALLDELAVAWAPSDVNVPFVAQQLGSKRRRYGRPRRLEVLPDHVILGRTAIVAVEFEALDPYVYSDAEFTVSTAAPDAGAGFLVPFEPPFTLPVSTSTGFVSAVMNGTRAAPWTIRLDGPLTNPTILHQEQERTLAFTANGGLVIATGEYVLIDSQARSVLLNGTADRRSNLAGGSSWFSLDPGANSIGFTADSGDGTLTLTWRDTYL